MYLKQSLEQPVARYAESTAYGPLLPREAPLAMPEQSLGAARDFDQFAPPPTAIRMHGLFERRLFLVIGSFLLGVAAMLEMMRPFAADGIGLFDIVLSLLFLSLFSWITFGFLNALAGFFVLLGNGPGLSRWFTRLRLPHRRTAVLMPIYNEETAAVFGRISQMSASIAAIGGQDLFDIFVLSDSRADMEPQELAALHDVRMISPVRIFYRRRTENIARKPGNIADWVRRFGAAYENMIVLDADSLMSGPAMALLASAMEERPGVGLIQTIPTVVNARTFFARWHQFAATAYGPAASAGLQWWSGTEATFWGHNAIVRVRAFADSCGLPRLSGPEPFGGHVLSHDMVEAALLRRNGWSVHMVSLPEGSHEEFPPTVADHSVRDRRWCQGNLQHVRLLATRGFHWINRLQLLMGASAYLTSPLWMLMLMLGMVASLEGTNPAFSAPPAPWLIALTIMLLLGPKVIALLWLTVDERLRQSLGGGRKLAATVAIEIPLSMLMAPITMVNQTMAILDILRGRPVGWVPQRRDADGMVLKDALILCRLHVAIGAVLLIPFFIGAGGAIWTVPVAIGLVLSPFTAMLTSRIDIGDWFAGKGLFAVWNGPATSVNAVYPAGKAAMELAFMRRAAGPATRP
ncbi:glucans biosynthesis glucosyltransferase MdoH [Sphingomonas sp. KC8]|uniref:glucans biosynthesis glucosyltransferase MdoH n=1 Tax=Sphingomonas sp. KC8 TaxID=1030157 RepID=UPI0002488E99|nr:glucans biosynthesis glucosyltransferase MdoH [Sphingomonas sp. KC8]ARS26665.1 glucosyltransferase MdoH [Sphingomonas sp. KC8]